MTVVKKIEGQTQIPSLIVRFLDTCFCACIAKREFPWLGTVVIDMFLLLFFLQGKMKSLLEDWRNLFSHQKQVGLTIITYCLILVIRPVYHCRHGNSLLFSILMFVSHLRSTHSWPRMTKFVTRMR